MIKVGKMNCQSCGSEVAVEASYVFAGLTVCDDCYLEKCHRVMACNPLATYSAKRFQESDGIEPEERLNDQQKTIFLFVKSRGKVTPKEVMNKFNLSLSEVENEFAVLRHLELTKGKKEGSKIYMVPF